MDTRIKKINSGQFYQFSKRPIKTNADKDFHFKLIYWASYSKLSKICFDIYSKRADIIDISRYNKKTEQNKLSEISDIFLFASLSGMMFKKSIDNAPVFDKKNNVLSAKAFGKCLKFIENAKYFNEDNEMIKSEYAFINFINAHDSIAKKSYLNEVDKILKSNHVNEYMFRRGGIMNMYYIENVKPNYQKAYFYFRKAVDIDSEFSYCLLRLSEVCLFLSKRSEAQKWLNRYLGCVPDWSVDHKFIEGIQKELA